MHFTTPALLALLSATLTIAAPTAHDDKKWQHKEKYNKDCDEDWKKKWEDDKWRKSEKLFYFSNSYYVKAIPDQVIATNGTAVPGQQGARGIFKYGINVDENTICYVCQVTICPISILIVPEHHTKRRNRQLLFASHYCHAHSRGRGGQVGSTPYRSCQPKGT